MIKIKQIGNGGAFDYKSVNSSFLIDTGNDSYFLFDCGHSVFAELRRQHDAGEIDLKKLKYVYISHNDDDHNGSLKTLIYFMYFNFGKRLHIIAVTGYSKDRDVYEKISEYTDDIDGFCENDQKIYDDLFNMIPINGMEVFNLDGFSIKPLWTNHFKPCYGLIFNCYTEPDEASKKFVITGDTKATINIMTIINDEHVKFVYHDFSNYDKPGSQVHCCKTDFEKTYTPVVRSKIIKYHNNEEFVTEWRTFDEVTIHQNIHERAKDYIDKRDAGKKEAKGPKNENKTK